MQPRTRRQKEVLDYIHRYIETHGYVPSYQQIARHLGVASKAGVAKHIEALENQGLISRRRENGSFSLDLRPVSTIAEAVCEIEWLDVQKNEALAEDWEKKRLFIPKFLLGYQTPERLRAYRVPNDAMLDEHICSGDVALIEKRSFARDGDVVVALTQNKRVVLKQFFRDGAKVELRPANPNYVSIMAAADKIVIMGVLRGILRPLT
jgi:repressor LexA